MTQTALPQVRAARILVIDDEAPIRDLCARVLARAGYQVTSAGSGEEGLARLGEEPVDLIVTDIRMPGLSGLDVLERAKAAFPGVRVILITGFGTPQTLARAEQAGADRILTKPFNPAELVAAVREILAPAG
ncbi:MAG: response regulator [Armatimonadota bacterium]|nr:response regulator [Armatimonadota bacterium]MDR7437642.1 response regulator [Armatimonadota bacterium]MDR7471646.1 response regulator [Armatimonadota bacterium]MDR7507866.1 response regulator [Armatimonadota bacterium]MDR7516867.1 response regulator [Armatimonadota bacterium]